MDIVYAAEKPSIAGLLSEHLQQPVEADDIAVAANPNETGSFLIRWQFERYQLSPSGQLQPLISHRKLFRNKR